MADSKPARIQASRHPISRIIARFNGPKYTFDSRFSYDFYLTKKNDVKNDPILSLHFL